jgi:hypothetical protein
VGVRIHVPALQLDDVARLMLRPLERLAERLPVLTSLPHHSVESLPRHDMAIHAVDHVLTPITTNVLKDYVDEGDQHVYNQFHSLLDCKNEADLARAMHQSMLFHDETSELEQVLASVCEIEYQEQIQEAIRLSNAMMMD